jgi:hypothetical protein
MPVPVTVMAVEDRACVKVWWMLEDVVVVDKQRSEESNGPEPEL